MRGAVKKQSAATADKTPPKKGAVQSKTGFSEHARSYWLHHRDSLLGSFVRLLRTPVQTLMTSLVVAIALALPITLLLSLENLNELGASWDANPKITVYLNVRARDAAIEQLREDLEAYPDIAAVEYLSPDEALADFQRFSGFDGVLDSLEDNPLPPTIIVSPSISAKAENLDFEQLEMLGARISDEAIVDSVQIDMDWVRRLQEIMVLGKKIVLALATLLGVGVLLAIGNTIRLAIENRRDEILVTKLVGATDGFVRRPFLYSGGWYGLFGGILACIIVALGFAIIEPSVSRLASLYQGSFTLHGLDLALSAKLLLGSTLLGWCGAWLAVGRHLALIEPH